MIEIFPGDTTSRKVNEKDGFLVYAAHYEKAGN